MMSTDKTEQALPPSEDREVLEAFIKDARAALTQRQQGGAGQAERALSDLLKAHAMHASCQAGLLDRCLCVRCASERARAALTAAPPAQPQSELLREAHGQIKHLIEDLTTTEDEGGLVRYVPKANLMFSNLVGALHTLAPKMEAALAAQQPERAAQQEAQEAAQEPMAELKIIGCVPASMANDPGLVALSEMAQSIDIFKDGKRVFAVWHHDAMFDVRDRICELLAAAPPLAVEPMQALTDEQIAEFAALCVMNRRSKKTARELLAEYREELARGIGKRERS